MEQLKKIGKLKAKKSSEIKYSKIGLGSLTVMFLIRKRLMTRLPNAALKK